MCLVDMRVLEIIIIIIINTFFFQSIKRVQEQSDLERIQDVFPNDFLRLYDKEAHTMVI